MGFLFDLHISIFSPKILEQIKCPYMPVVTHGSILGVFALSTIAFAPGGKEL